MVVVGILAGLALVFAVLAFLVACVAVTELKNLRTAMINLVAAEPVPDHTPPAEAGRIDVGRVERRADGLWWVYPDGAEYQVDERTVPARLMPVPSGHARVEHDGGSDLFTSPSE